MTDRELLELSAKAIGLDFRVVDVEGGWKALVVTGMRVWNPLSSNRDAFRLSVRLGITAHQYSTCVVAKRHRGDGINCEESFGDDPYAATRRSIVRAAAEVGARAPARTEEVGL